MRDNTTAQRIFRRTLLSMLLLLAACPKQPHLQHKRLSPSLEKTPPEVMRPEEMSRAPETDSPKRAASQELADKGIAALDANDIDGAIQALQNAINVDPANGAAYFYLARATYANGKPDAALGFLDKAETLIGRDEDWKAEIDTLRHEIDEDGAADEEKSDDGTTSY